MFLSIGSLNFLVSALFNKMFIPDLLAIRHLLVLM